MTQDKRSPIEDKPLHHPGQSLEERFNEQLQEEVFLPGMAAFVLVWFAGVEWWYYFNPATRNPLAITLVVVAVVAYIVWRIWRTLPELRQLRQGIEGEKAVGQFLEGLRAQGYQVFHDLGGAGFNVDHVVIGPAGVFTVETKTLSKPLRGRVKILYDGETVRVNGQPMERDPVRQAKAQAKWLARILAEYSGREFEVHPVVLFPGWYVQQKPETRRAVWVLSHKALPVFLDNAPKRLAADAVKLASNNLSRYIRSQ